MKRDVSRDFLLEQLQQLDTQTLATAYLYAKNYTRYGVDVTKEWLTATQQSASLEKAYYDGYGDAIERFRKELVEK